MPLTYRDLKNRRYLEPTRNFIESLLNIKFRDGDRAFCPFHNDTKDSFWIYVNGKEEVRFHCFGGCGGDWDIYDIIMLKDQCNFRQAQKKFSEYLGLKDIEFHRGRYQYLDEESNEPEEPIARVDDEDLTDEHRKV